MRKYLRGVLLLVLAVAALAGLAFVWDFGSMAIWDGGYPVQVVIQRTSARPVGAAAAVVLFSWEWNAVDGDETRVGSKWKPVDMADGSSFEVYVKCSGKDSGFGRRISYVRQEILVVKVDYTDGSKQLLVADLPESCCGRQLALRVP